MRLPKLSRKSKLTILCTSSVFLLIAAVTLVTGRVRGTEFAPSHFQKRTFEFWEIPLLRLQVTPISRSPATISVTNYLRSKNALSIPKSPPEKWDLVDIQRGLSPPVLADAEILTARLDLWNNSKNTYVWDNWSRSHPDAAVILWPVVQTLAQRELYIMLPELFELAQRNTTGNELRQAIDLWLPAAYARLADDLYQAKQSEMAFELLQEALSEYPDAEILQQQLGIIMPTQKESGNR